MPAIVAAYMEWESNLDCTLGYKNAHPTPPTANAAHTRKLQVLDSYREFKIWSTLCLLFGRLNFSAFRYI